MARLFSLFENLYNCISILHKLVQIFAKYLGNLLEATKRFQKFSQSGKILPNLVTLNLLNLKRFSHIQSLKMGRIKILKQERRTDMTGHDPSLAYVNNEHSSIFYTQEIIIDPLEHNDVGTYTCAYSIGSVKSPVCKYSLQVPITIIKLFW